MKKCPSCGYEDTPTERQLLRQYKKAFGDIPVRAMINRQWIGGGELLSVEEVRAELIRFFELKDAAELDAFMRGEFDPLERMLGRPPRRPRADGARQRTLTVERSIETMAVREMPTTYRASDDKEFNTKEEAERHDAVITATRELATAQHRLGRVLAEREKTADGHQFDFTVLGDYHFVTPGWGGMPTLSRVSFYVWSCWFDVDEQGRVTIRKRTQTGRASDGERIEEYQIRKLYRDERAAKRALFAAQEEWLSARAAEVEKLRAEVAPPSR